jgi:hypothetical protein
MDFLEFSDVSFDSNANIGHLCEELNDILGESICYVWYVQDSKYKVAVVCEWCCYGHEQWKMKCGTFGLYPTFVAGTLRQEINFHVLCNNKLNYSDYIEKCISGKQCIISFKSH